VGPTRLSGQLDPEAHALLAPIYSWFTGGLDTADLQEVGALLEAPAGSRDKWLFFPSTLFSVSVFAPK
jgi:hypothetical protein